MNVIAHSSEQLGMNAETFKASVSLFAAAFFILLLPSCSTPSSTRVQDGDRNPASFCHPTLHDKEEAERVLAEPGKFEARRKQLLKATVQGYLLGAELLDKFDRLLDGKQSMRAIYFSRTYLQLQALHKVRQEIRHSLEDIYMGKINKELAENIGADRKTVIVRNVDEAEHEIESLMHAKTDNRFTRLALVEVAESFEDLRDYYVSCDYTVLSGNYDVRLKTRKALVEDSAGAPAPAYGAHLDWAPKDGEEGLHVGEIVDDAADVLREELGDMQLREPQATALYAPGVGANGNITGNSFPKGAWALTFDDGPAGTTPRVLDNLKKHDIKATFFMLSQNIKSKIFSDTAKRIQSQGQALASHSISHPMIPKLSAEGRVREIVGAAKMFEDFFGEKPKFFRLPYGAGVNNAGVRKIIADAGMIHVYWNVDTLDWQDKNPESIFQRAVKQMERLGRGVILFHDIHPQSVIASEKVMTWLQDPKRNLRLVTLPEIVDEMNAAAPAVAPK